MPVRSPKGFSSYNRPRLARNLTTFSTEGGGGPGENIPSPCHLTEQSVRHEKKETTQILQRLQDPAGKPVASSRTGKSRISGTLGREKGLERCTVCLVYEIVEYEEVVQERYRCTVGGGRAVLERAEP